MTKRSKPEGSPATALAQAATDNAKVRRGKELAECQATITALLEKYDATFAVTQQMELSLDNTARYGYSVRVVSR